MQACVEVWESDPEAYPYNPVGYIALGASVQEADLEATFERQERIGYRSELIAGEAEVDAHMKALFPDWRAQGVTCACTSTRAGSRSTWSRCTGYTKSASRRASRCSRASRSRASRSRDDGTISAVETSEGAIEVGEQVVIAPGPWAKRFWAMLGMPDTIDMRDAVRRRRPRPADVDVLEPPGGRGQGRPDALRDRRRRRAAGHPPRHRRPASTPTTGDLVTDELWGIYFKRDRHSVQGGASPLVVEDDVELDPYPPTTDIDPGFPDIFCAALSHSMSRFEGCRALYKQARSGGVGAFTVDNFPVFDYFRPNLYGIFDSNHGYKMIGVGREVAGVLLGDHSACSTRSASSASRPATSTPSRARPIPGLGAAGRPRRRRLSHGLVDDRRRALVPACCLGFRWFARHVAHAGARRSTSPWSSSAS